MGNACWCLNIFSEFQIADWIQLLGIFVNASLGFWIVRTIQNKLTNKRVLKDHFINEVKDLRNDYERCLNSLCSEGVRPRDVIPWFKLMNIRVNDLMSFVSTRYKLDKTLLHPYQFDLRELVTNNDDFISGFKSDFVNFSDKSRIEIVKFLQSNSRLFNEIIIKINDSD